VEVHDAAVDVWGSFSPAEKFGFEAPVGAFDEVAVTLDVRSPAPSERVRRLVAHAERGCHSAQSLQARVPVRLVARLNGDDLEPEEEEP
jgi:organic hydroperoxide reductase OsmC/OhrA